MGLNNYPGPSLFGCVQYTIVPHSQRSRIGRIVARLPVADMPSPINKRKRVHKMTYIQTERQKKTARTPKQTKVPFCFAVPQSVAQLPAKQWRL